VLGYCDFAAPADIAFNGSKRWIVCNRKLVGNLVAKDVANKSHH
jgi:hypothetical protein